MNLLAYWIAKAAKREALAVENKKLELRELELKLKYGNVVPKDKYDQVKKENEALKDQLFNKKQDA